MHKTKNKQQKKQQKILKHGEAEQHIAPWSMSHQRNK
jgi:hypothetical protein